jgi:tetratricopeptide (TPR) repeat protein
MNLLSIGFGLRLTRLAKATLLIGVFAAATSIFLNLCAVAQTEGPEQVFNEAVAAQQRGDDAVAVSKYKELLRLHPEALAVRVNLGATLAHSKRFREAIDQYRIVLASDPRNSLARMNLALAYQGNGELASAIKELERLHQDDPEDTQSVMVLADCFVQSRRGADAVRLLAPLESAQPDDPDLEWLLGSALIQAGRAPEGVSRVEKAAGKTANAEAYLLAGQTRLGMSQFDLARRDAGAAEGLDPNLPGLHTLRGMIQEQTADYDGAEASLLRALAANPKDFNAQYYLGAIYYFKRDLEKARLHLMRALELQPDSSQARFELALVARAEGNLDSALRDLESVVRASPDWLEPHVELSALYYRLDRPEDGAKQKQLVDRMMAAQQQSQSQAAH